MALLLLFAALSALCTLSFAETEAEHREHGKMREPRRCFSFPLIQFHIVCILNGGNP